MINITEKNLDKLRLSVGEKLSLFRYEHTLGVERMARRLALILAPEKLNILRAAALLHDVTKEKTFEEHMDICRRFEYELRDDEKRSPAILHAITASLIIPDEYPELADKEIISAVRWHTTGKENMSLCDKIIYLADYIEDTRTYENCIALREEFFGAEPENMTDAQKKSHLDGVILHSLDMTVKGLVNQGKEVCLDTLRAKEYIEKNKRQI